MKNLKVKDVMTPGPRMIDPAQSVKEAAQLMKETGCGVLPVGEPNHVIGIITDRDISVRIVAEGENPEKVLVREAMSAGHFNCAEEDSLEHAAAHMRKHNVSRLLVTRDETVTGIVTLGDLLRWPQNLRESDKVLHILLGRGKEQESKHAA